MSADSEKPNIVGGNWMKYCAVAKSVGRSRPIWTSVVVCARVACALRPVRSIPVAIFLNHDAQSAAQTTSFWLRFELPSDTGKEKTGISFKTFEKSQIHLRDQFFWNGLWGCCAKRISVLFPERSSWDFGRYGNYGIEGKNASKYHKYRTSQNLTGTFPKIVPKFVLQNLPTIFNFAIFC